MIYQGIRLPCKNDQGNYDPTTRTQAKIHARMIKFHNKYFIESIPYEQVNPSQKRSKCFQKFTRYRKQANTFSILPRNRVCM